MRKIISVCLLGGSTNQPTQDLGREITTHMLLLSRSQPWDLWILNNVLCTGTSHGNPEQEWHKGHILLAWLVGLFWQGLYACFGWWIACAIAKKYKQMHYWKTGSYFYLFIFLGGEVPRFSICHSLKASLVAYLNVLVCLFVLTFWSFLRHSLEQII